MSLILSQAPFSDFFLRGLPVLCLPSRFLFLVVEFVPVGVFMGGISPVVLLDRFLMVLSEYLLFKVFSYYLFMALFTWYPAHFDVVVDYCRFWWDMVKSVSTFSLFFSTSFLQQVLQSSLNMYVLITRFYALVNICFG